MKETLKTLSEDELLVKIYFSVMGFFLAILVFALILGSLYGVGYGCVIGYQKWFSTTEMVSVGDAGYYYDHANACFIKPYPHRKVLKGCYELEYQDSDSIGIVLTSDYEYRYVNLNTMKYLNEMTYSRASLFQGGCAYAITQDSLYTLRADGSVISAELANWLYASIDEIICYAKEGDENENLFYSEKKTGMFMYEVSKNSYGLMSSDFVRLTEPVFSEITALSPDIFFCKYQDTGLGVMIDKKGNVMK